VMARSTIKEEMPLAREGIERDGADGRATGKGGVRLDLQRRIGREPGARARVWACDQIGITDDCVADQPVEFDRLIGGVDHPSDQITAWAWRRRDAGRINPVSTWNRPVGGKGELAVDRQVDVEIRLQADVGADIFDGRADS